MLIEEVNFTPKLQCIVNGFLKIVSYNTVFNGNGPGMQPSLRALQLSLTFFVKSQVKVKREKNNKT